MKHGTELQASTDSIFQEIDRAGADAPDWYRLSGRLREFGEREGVDVRALVLSLDYALREAEDDSARRRWGALGPRVEYSDGSSYPRPVTEMSEEVVRVWQVALEHVSEPLVVSRLCDLLWHRRVPGADQYARRAIQAYLRLLAGEGDRRHVAAKSGRRAVDLALELNDRHQARAVGEALVARATESLNTGGHEPGLPVRLAVAAGRLRDEAQPAGLDLLLDAIERRYIDEPPVIEAIWDLQARRAGSEMREVRRRQVQAWLRLAETGGAAGLFHLRRALNIAELHGLRDEAAEIRMRIQQVDRSQLGLQELTTQLDIDAGRVRGALDEIVGHDSFADAIRRLAVAFGPPAGDPARNEALVDEISRDHPLLFMMAEHVLGPENTTIAIVAGPDEHRSAALRRQEALSIGWFATLVADALDLALDRYGRPTRAELASAFAGSLVGNEIADRIARGVELYLDGDADAAGHMIAPRLERIIRGMARDSGLLVLREPYGGRPGGVRSLNELLAELEDRMPEGWRRYLVNLLADPLGHNLRNLVGHGLLDEVSRPHAAMLIHAAAVLGAMGPSSETSSA